MKQRCLAGGGEGQVLVSRGDDLVAAGKAAGVEYSSDPTRSPEMRLIGVRAAVRRFAPNG